MPFDTPSKYAGIIIRMDHEADSVVFPTLVNEALDKIASKPIGRKLIEGIGRHPGGFGVGYTICIKRANMLYDRGCKPKPKILVWLTRKPNKPKREWEGTNKAVRISEIDATDLKTGSATAIFYNANMMKTPDGDRPSWIGLAHELIHAYYNLKGKGLGMKMIMNVNGMVEQEEMATVGLGPGKHRSKTENKIREEHNLPLRRTYGGK